MAKTADDYLATLQAGLPPGPAWARRAPVMTGLFHAFGDGYQRIDQRLDELLPQADPRAATDLLADWEDSLGLPDPCIGQLPNLDSRAAFAFQRHTDDGGQSIAHFIAMARLIGFNI